MQWYMFNGGKDFGVCYLSSRAVWGMLNWIVFAWDGGDSLTADHMDVVVKHL